MQKPPTEKLEVFLCAKQETFRTNFWEIWIWWLI